MKRVLYIILTICLTVSCKHITADFTYSPEQPKEGEYISFTNTSSGGDEWAWDFGDNSNSASKSPSKYYKKPGTYYVTLKVNGKSSFTRTKKVTVYDSIPTFQLSCDTGVIRTDNITAFTDLSFTPMIYNPFFYKVSYRWELDEHTQVLGNGRVDTPYIKVFVNKANNQTTFTLHVTQKDSAYTISKTFNVLTRPSYALLLQQGSTLYRQRLYEARGVGELETITHPTEEIQGLISTIRNDEQRLNGTTFDCTTIGAIVGSTVDGFQIDVLTRKIYFYNSNALYVCNLDGTHKILLDDEGVVTYICVDNQTGCIFWNTGTQTKATRLLQSPTNTFDETEVWVLNSIGVNRLTIDPITR